MTWKTTSLLAIGAAFALNALTGCVALYKTRPHDLTVRGHEEAAMAEEGKADKAAQDSRSVGRGAQYAHYMAPRYRELAESHRAAARSLREEEARACNSIPMAVAGAAMPEIKVTSVEEIRRATVPPVVHSARGYSPVYLTGAKLTIQAEASPAEVERFVACRVAHAASEGDDGIDPLGVRGTTIKVVAPEARPLLLEIVAEDQPTAGEVLRRARALAAR